MEIPQKLKIEPPCDPAVPLVSVHPKKMKTVTQKDICTHPPTYTAALFKIAKVRKPPMCPPADERVKKNGFFLAIEKEGNSTSYDNRGSIYAKAVC